VLEQVAVVCVGDGVASHGDFHHDPRFWALLVKAAGFLQYRAVMQGVTVHAFMSSGLPGYKASLSPLGVCRGERADST
jgi:hypothetical protein